MPAACRYPIALAGSPATVPWIVGFVIPRSQDCRRSRSGSGIPAWWHVRAVSCACQVLIVIVLEYTGAPAAPQNLVRFST